MLPISDNIAAAYEFVPRHSNNDHVIGANDLVGWMTGCSQDGPDGSMLIGDIQIVKDIECMPFTPREGLPPSQEIFYPGAGGLNPIDPAFEICPVITRREHQVFILCASINSNDFPKNMVKSAANVVDSIAYYDGKNIGDGFDKADLDNWLASLSVILDGKSVRLAQCERFELPFKVRDVMICSF